MLPREENGGGEVVREARQGRGGQVPRAARRFAGAGSRNHGTDGRPRLGGGHGLGTGYVHLAGEVYEVPKM